MYFIPLSSWWFLAVASMDNFSRRLQDQLQFTSFDVFAWQMLKGPGLILSVLPLSVPSFNYWSHYVNIRP